MTREVRYLSRHCFRCQGVHLHPRRPLQSRLLEILECQLLEENLVVVIHQPDSSPRPVALDMQFLSYTIALDADQDFGRHHLAAGARQRQTNPSEAMQPGFPPLVRGMNTLASLTAHHANASHSTSFPEGLIGAYGLLAAGPIAALLPSRMTAPRYSRQ